MDIVWLYSGSAPLLGRIFGPLERLLYRLCGIDKSVEMTWRQYAVAVLSISLVSFVAVYGLQRIQGWLPLNPESLPAVSPDSSFNTAVSFTTNTNWQGYGGETTMSYLTQMLALTVQNFVSAAAGMAVLVALIRGFTRHTADTSPRDPLRPARYYQSLMDSGKFESRAALARFLGVSRARVTQVLNRLMKPSNLASAGAERSVG